MELLDRIQATTANLFPEVLGIRFLAVDPDRVEAELSVRPELCTTPGVMHGGAIMGFADTLGAYATVLNLPEGAGTTTLESKTNFFARATTETTLVGETTPLHRGARTQVWQTRVRRPDDRLVALVTQTQIVLPKQQSPQEQLAGLFSGGDLDANQALLATLERSGGSLYRGWADAVDDPEIRAELLEAATREEQNAEVLERLVKRRGGSS